MSPLRVLMLTAVAAFAIALGQSQVNAAQCGGLHKLKVTDLNMIPDPARAGERIQYWLIKLNADGNGECATRIRITDKNQVAGNDVLWKLRPGENTIKIPANSGYKMQAQDHCFLV